MAVKRWFALSATWDESEWLAELPGHAANCWPRLLAYAKLRGSGGLIKAPSLRLLANQWKVDLADVEQLVAAAFQDGAIEERDGDWFFTAWEEWNPKDTTAAERMRRYRKSKSRLSTARKGATDEEDEAYPVTRNKRNDRNARSAAAGAERGKPASSTSTEQPAEDAAGPPESAEAVAGAADTPLRRVTRNTVTHRNRSVARDSDSDSRDDGSPSVPRETETPSLPPAAIGRPHAREEASTNGSGTERQQRRLVLASLDGEDAIRAEMADQLEGFLDDHVPESRQRSFRAAAGPIVSGLSTATWAGPDGSQVPWTERSRLFTLALAKCAAEQRFGSNDLHSTLRYVIPQQLDPIPSPRARERAPPGSEAARVKNEYPGRDRMYQPASTGMELIGDHVWDESANRWVKR